MSFTLKTVTPKVQSEYTKYSAYLGKIQRQFKGSKQLKSKGLNSTLALSHSNNLKPISHE